MTDNIKLFSRLLGIFKGFIESGHEFVAEIITPYHPEFVPLLGAFMAVRITETEALLGRITQFYPVGTMAGAEAEEYLAQLQKLERQVPEDVKELKLRYSVKMRLLGTVELSQGQFRYRPGVRTLPHLGAAVGELTEKALNFVCNVRLQQEENAVPIGYYSLGDRVYSQHPVLFSFSRLQAKRTLVFARAGYGKSNLIKLLVAKLYEQEQKVGMLIFDPEGEYAFPDAQGRPGLANLPGVAERLVVFTDRKPPDQRFERLIAGPVKLDLRYVHPRSVVEICLPPDRRSTNYANRVRGLNKDDEWPRLVELLKQNGYRTDEDEIKKHFGVKQHIDALIRNFVPIIDSIHAKDAQLPHTVRDYLAKGNVVIVDISLLSSSQGQQIAGLILKTIFDHNVAHFTATDDHKIIPVIAVIEEAQNVLSSTMMEEDSPFVEWVKEGRKYQLGSILVTQQPGAISDRLLSQADNFFVMHLVSGVDLDVLQKSNAHFSNDLLAYILNEPIEGNVYFWSAPAQPYVISAKLFNFEEYVREQLQRKGEPAAEKLGETVQAHQDLVNQIAAELEQLVWQTITTDQKVPVYTPLCKGEVIGGYGAIREWNLRLKVAEKFFQDHPDISAMSLPQFFSEWKGTPILQHSYISRFGKSVKDRESKDFLLMHLGKIRFEGSKKLDTRTVEFQDQELVRETPS